MIKGLPEKLKSLRWKYNYSQKQVADKLEISPSVVSAYETGERTPSIEVLLSLSYIYNCSVDYLLGRNFSSSDTIIKTDGLNEKQIKALNDLIETMR